MLKICGGGYLKHTNKTSPNLFMYLNMGRHCVSSVIASHGDGPLSCEAKAEVAIRQVSHQGGQGHFCDCG